MRCLIYKYDIYISFTNSKTVCQKLRHFDIKVILDTIDFGYLNNFVKTFMKGRKSASLKI